MLLLLPQLLLLALLAPCALTESDQPPFYRTPAGGIGVAAGGWAQPLPLALQTVAADGAVTWTHAAYTQADGASGRASGTLTSPGGAVLRFEDAYSACSACALTLARSVTVLSAGAGGEVGFATQFSLPSPPALARAPRRLFMPGVAYEDAAALPAGALAGDPDAPAVLVREDRLPLPLVVAHYAGAGAGALTHARPSGATLPGEAGAARITDARLQFGSLGVLTDAAAAAAQQPPWLSLAFQYPGSEGSRTYVQPSRDGWANRSHPLAPAPPGSAPLQHAYQLRFEWAPSASASYYDAARAAWRAAYAAAAPSPPSPAPAPPALWRAGADLLARVGARYSGVPSMPFEARLPDGVVVDSSSQMGFVGRALPAAALLLYDALHVAPNATRAAAARDILSLWAGAAFTPCGAAKTWYNIVNGSIAFRACDAYQGALRISADGAAGLLAAARYQEAAPGGGSGGERAAAAAWRAAALAHADALLRAQAPSGAIAGAFDWQCQPLSSDLRQTAFAVPLLVAAAGAAGSGGAAGAYRAGALRAGAYAAAAGAASWSYAGGAVDNGGVADREGGWLAAAAFAALYDMTGAVEWLAPAARAAAYAETFVYFWDVPLDCSAQPPPVFPCARSTVGTSLIATGQSGADSYMAIAWRTLARLGGWLNDTHFGDVAAVLYAGTSQATDWDGALGYAERGLLNEAVALAVTAAPRGAGVADWLPWLTANLLQPLAEELEAAAGRRGGRA